MPQKKGITNNPKGRPRGTKNKATKLTREFIQKFLDDNAPRMQKDFMLLEPKDRLILMEKLIKYILPAQKAISFDLDNLDPDQLDQVINHLKQQ